MSDTLDVIQGTRMRILDLYVYDENGDHITMDSNWKCYKGVCDFPNSNRTMFIEKTEVPLSDNNLYFPAGLTPAETTSLDEGYYYFVAEISNTTTTPPENQEYHRKIKIKGQGIE